MSNAESAANCLICLINQTAYLLDNQMRGLSEDLIKAGDFKERYRKARQRQALRLNEPDDDEFLKSQGLRRLENGRVVLLNGPAEE